MRKTRSPAASPGELYVGIDIAAAKSDVHLLGEYKLSVVSFEIKQTAEGYKLLISKLAATGIERSHCHIVMEATGSYWIDLAIALHAGGYRPCVVNPRQAHHFVKSLPSRSKTDKLDAEALARMAQQTELPKWEPPAPIYYKLRAYLTRHDDITDRITALKNQRHAYLAIAQYEKAIISLINEEIKRLTAEKEQILNELPHICREDAEWSRVINLLLSIKGIGILTSCWMVVATNNFSTCANVEALVNYLGLAPLHHESGKSVRGGSHMSKASNGRVRQKLYMAAMSAITHNEVVKTYYHRLVKVNHKKKMVALCASMRKLVHICWAVVKRGVPFAIEVAATKG